MQRFAPLKAPGQRGEDKNLLHSPNKQKCIILIRSLPCASLAELSTSSSQTGLTSPASRQFSVGGTVPFTPLPLALFVVLLMRRVGPFVLPGPPRGGPPPLRPAMTTLNFDLSREWGGHQAPCTCQPVSALPDTCRRRHSCSRTPSHVPSAARLGLGGLHGHIPVIPL